MRTPKIFGLFTLCYVHYGSYTYATNIFSIAVDLYWSMFFCSFTSNTLRLLNTHSHALLYALPSISVFMRFRASLHLTHILIQPKIGTYFVAKAQRSDPHILPDLDLYLGPCSCLAHSFT